MNKVVIVTEQVELSFEVFEITLNEIEERENNALPRNFFVAVQL